MNSESMGTLPCHANIIQRKVKIFSKAAARPLRFSEARIILCLIGGLQYRHLIPAPVDQTSVVPGCIKSHG